MTSDKDPVEIIAEQAIEIARLTGLTAQLTAQLGLVLQYFVKERCEGQPIDNAELEKTWDAAAMQFHEMMDFLTDSKRRDGDGEQQ